ncbi:hypothetical protein SELMODRAFT_409279 [Selaginella moellendorffii]|uniref:Uncharacterized protein n=1 Tax=Selaginella moellendorffii TaxID=88036 RepID=D8RAY5_SELML|nr:hypothetical protein SELMODRAFT_409279 [Selaginella moellendorffii]
MTWEHTMKLNMTYHKINMLNQFAFQAYTLVYDIEHLQFICMLSLEEPIIKGERASFFKNAQGMRTGKALEEFIYNISKTKMSFVEQTAKQRKMLQDKDGEGDEGEGEIPAQEITIPTPHNPQKGCHEAFHENVAESSHQSSWRTKTFFPSLPTATDDDLEELSSATMHKQVRSLSPTASVGEIIVLIGDYMQLLDATSRELYMLDRWIHGLGQLTPYGKIDFFFFDLPDGMPPLQGDTLSWNVLQAQHISQALKVASSFMTYKGVVVMILPCSLIWEGLLAHLADNNDGFVEFSFGCLLSSMTVDTKGTNGQKQKVYS